MINLTATFQAKPEHRDTLEVHLKAMLEPTRQEEGCIRYVLLNNNQQPNIFMFQEQFASQNAFDQHCSQPYFLNLLHNIEGLLEQEVEIQFYTEL